MIMGVSAWHLLKKNENDFFVRSFKMAAVWALVASIGVAITGDMHAAEIAEHQPTKFAAMESLWETKRNVGMSLFLIPDAKNERNLVESFTIPSLLSYYGTS